LSESGTEGLEVFLGLIIQALRGLAIVIAPFNALVVLSSSIMCRVVKRIAAVLTVVCAGIAVFAWWATYALMDATDLQLGNSGSRIWGRVSVLATALAFIGLTICLIRYRLPGATEEEFPGLCQNCGYDLRATPLRCPECGAVPEATVER
jgi:hypothetical protein